MKIHILLILFFCGFQASASPLQVLILSGQNNHDWEKTTPVLKEILQEDGLAEVQVTESPQTLTSDDLIDVDIIVSNWNSFGNKEGIKPVTEWPEITRQAYVEFVRNGGGHVVVHAGSASFYDWEDYHSICLATWRDGTGHKAIHNFAVRITERDHPITDGMETFTITDELWFRPAIQPGAQVLAESFSKTTGNWEPTALVGQFGKGRCFTLLLGDNVQGLSSPHFQALLRRGVAWTGKESTQSR